MLGLGMQKIFIDKSTSIRQAGKDIYYKSHQEQFQHDWQIDDLENGGFRRMEDMDDTYLKIKIIKIFSGRMEFQLRNFGKVKNLIT